MFKCLEFVCVARNQDVDVKLALQESEAGHVAPGNDLVAVDQPNLKLPHSDHFLFRIIQILGLKAEHENETSKKDLWRYPLLTLPEENVLSFLGTNLQRTAQFSRVEDHPFSSSQG